MQCFTVTHNGATNLKVLRMRRKSLVCLFTQHDTLLPLVKINFLSHFSSEALLLCALSQRLFGHILFLYSCIAPLVSRLQPQAQLKERRPYYAPGSTITPQPSQPPPLRNQQHCVTWQITSQRPPTPAQTLYVLALVVLQLPPTKPPLDPICQVETGCEKWLCFSAEPRGSEPELIAVYLTINKTDHQSQQDALQTSN